MGSELESRNENMTLTHLSTFGIGIGFTGVGLLLRKEHKKNWKAFLLGGIAMLVLVFVSLIFGLSM